MKNFFLISLCSNIIQFNLIFSISILLFTIIIYYYVSFSNKQILIKDYNTFNWIKFFLLFELSIFLVINIIVLFLYSFFLKNSNLLLINFYEINSFYYFSIPMNIFSFSLNLDLIGIIFSNLAFFVGLVSLLALDTRFYWNNIKFIFICNILVLVIFIFTITNNYLVFF